MLQSTLELQLLTPDDWQLLRKVRLEALRESPHAFMSTYAHESEWAEAQWRGVFDDATWIVAHEAMSLIGLARSVGEPGRPTVRDVESIWVAPTHRRRGIFRGLLHTLAEMERRNGVTELLLWILEDNHDAQCAYEALGFELTEERQFLHTVGRFERRLRLELNTHRTLEPSWLGF